MTLREYLMGRIAASTPPKDRECIRVCGTVPRPERNTMPYLVGVDRELTNADFSEPQPEGNSGVAAPLALYYYPLRISGGGNISKLHPDYPWSLALMERILALRVYGEPLTYEILLGVRGYGPPDVVSRAKPKEWRLRLKLWSPDRPEGQWVTAGRYSTKEGAEEASFGYQSRAVEVIEVW